MIIITLNDAVDRDPTKDALGRSLSGYKPGMTDAEMYEANRGCWVLGTRADREEHVLFSYRGTVVGALAFDAIEDVPERGRRAFVGHPLKAGDPIYDAYVHKPTPVQQRNPIRYWDSPLSYPTCRCGCGGQVTRGKFLPGHDQRALHERVALLGGVAEFLDWFDNTYEDSAA
jgi:hypothetical protein